MGSLFEANIEKPISLDFDLDEARVEVMFFVSHEIQLIIVRHPIDYNKPTDINPTSI